jgi:hypothetical protein
MVKTQMSGAVSSMLNCRACSLVLVLAALGGCGGASVSVPALFPVPLVDRIPLPMGLHLDESLTGYVHAEELEEQGEWEIDLGSAQTQMFQNLLSGMFDSVYTVANPAEPGGEVAGVLVPNISEVQFSTPLQTRSDYFEVWVRYRFQLYGRDGELLGEWPLTAYGKADEDNYGLQSREPALQAAAVAACRDAMAFFTVQFRTVPEVRQWLLTEAGEPSR